VSDGVSAAPDALGALLAGVVDYAGLFPPAALDMHAAVANYASYRAGPDRWMLGRFVVPAAQLEELATAVGALPMEHRLAWRGARISAILSGEFASQALEIEAFNARAAHGMCIDVVEGRTPAPDAVLAMAAAMPNGVTLYCELPHRDDPVQLLPSVRAAAARAKLRTGGVTTDAFPAPSEIVRFLRRCHDAGVTAKVTAGLHHALRAEYALTYAPAAQRGMMFGYLNVFLCAAAIGVGASDATAMDILMLTDRTRITRTTDGVRAAGCDITTASLVSARRDRLVAFGSCSFREPVDELAALGLVSRGWADPHGEGHATLSLEHTASLAQERTRAGSGHD
jgi:hypothetical protein